ncbi:hypothetical protein IT401_01550 [Candidatus Nomurabacteria bacterium]|nr:hypothetical protein [Candidatus Nomurabacteria bacterium]
MKKISLVLLVGAVATLFGCKKDDVPVIPPHPVDTTDHTAPTVPATLTGTPATTTVALSWTASYDSVGVAGYILYRGNDSIAALTGLAYTDSGLVPQTTYTYQVLAYDAAGNRSAKSTSLPVTTLFPSAVPTVVTSINATDIRTTHIFSGTITDDGGGPIIERFLIIKWTDPMTGDEQRDSISVQGTGTTFSYTKTDCYPGLGYSCQAGARNALGIGYGQWPLLYGAGRYVGMDVGYGIVVHTYANYDSAAVISYTDLNFMAGAEFGNPSIHIYETASDLLAGKRNTDMILVQDPGPSAARVCRQYTEAGKVWSLPSTEEWVQIKAIKHCYLISNSFFGVHLSTGGYIGKYWTSTQASGTAQAYQMDIWDDNSSIGTGEKNSSYAIRPITYIGPNE